MTTGILCDFQSVYGLHILVSLTMLLADMHCGHENEQHVACVTQSRCWSNLGRLSFYLQQYGAGHLLFTSKVSTWSAVPIRAA